jgi:hypothetical protein
MFGQLALLPAGGIAGAAFDGVVAAGVVATSGVVVALVEAALAIAAPPPTSAAVATSVAIPALSCLI